MVGRGGIYGDMHGDGQPVMRDEFDDHTKAREADRLAVLLEQLANGNMSQHDMAELGPG